MIEKICIQNEASYGDSAETLSPLAKFNFIYGSNGSGKTTISRIIANQPTFPHCQITWRGNIPLEPLVYNRDFVANNFHQSLELKGIFTLGDNAELDKIDVAKKELTQLKDDEIKLKNVLDGKNVTLQEIEDDFENNCWKLKQKHDSIFQTAFSGVRDKKIKFKNKLIDEDKSNTAELKDYEYLKDKSKTLFNESPTAQSAISSLNDEALLTLESNAILKKIIIGSENIDIASMIKKLGNSDWVKKGKAFYETNDGICPFCQQQTETDFANSLSKYFNETYNNDIAKIDTLLTNYKNENNQLTIELQSIINNPSTFIDSEKLRLEKEVLDSKIKANLQKIDAKKNEPSRTIELDSLNVVLADIASIINVANNKIKEHNRIVANFGTEKSTLIAQVWKFLLEIEIKEELNKYTTKKTPLTKAISNLDSQIKTKRQEYKDKDAEIKNLEKNTTSIEPTINAINELLKSFDFMGFHLASEEDKFYKIKRADGTDAKETLSEGEKTFITFLYFFHLLKGSESETGITIDRIVVFDDPISSLDSDVLFIVSSLIRSLFDDIKNNIGHIKQLFVLTHNVYFHREVAYNSKRNDDKTLNDETFWTIRKSNQFSKVIPHNNNPIKTSYELLWAEIKNSERSSNILIQNTLRRILEYYFKMLGGVPLDNICNYFDGKEKIICKSLVSWIQSGSHFPHDDEYSSVDDAAIDNYLNVFRKIFIETKHEAHYEMMMR